MKLGNSVVSWEAKKRRTVALSSTEAEYLAMSEVAKEILFIRYFVSELFNTKQCVNLFNDNQGSIKLLKIQLIISEQSILMCDIIF